MDKIGRRLLFPVRIFTFDLHISKTLVLSFQILAFTSILSYLSIGLLKKEASF